METERPAAYAALVAELSLRPGELEAWERAAAAMYVPYDERRGMHPQDANFLEREVWDLEAHAGRITSRCCCTTTRSSSTATR